MNELTEEAMALLRELIRQEVERQLGQLRAVIEEQIPIIARIAVKTEPDVVRREAYEGALDALAKHDAQQLQREIDEHLEDES